RRRRESASAKRKRHCDKRSHIVRQVRDRAVWLATADRRAIRTLGGIHQDISCAIAVEALVSAGGGIALNAPALGPAKVGTFEKASDRHDAFSPWGEATVASNAHAACGRPALWLQRQSNVEPAGGQETGSAIWPFHKGHRTFRGIVETEFSQFSRP